MPIVLNRNIKKWLDRLEKEVSPLAATGGENRTCVALQQLKEAVAEDIKDRTLRQLPRLRPRRSMPIVKEVKRWQQRYRRAEARILKLKTELSKHIESKTNNRIDEEWIVRVITCAPHQSARSLADAFALAAGSDANMISRPSIRTTKDAWLEMYSIMVVKHIGVKLASHMAASNNNNLVCLHLVHVQDEAELRMLSTDSRDGPTVPRRGRTSKIQLNVLHAWIRDTKFDVPTDLVPLANKQASTLATCFEDLLRKLCSDIAATVAATGGELPRMMGKPWVIHIMIGDGIYTNEAAVTLLLRMLHQTPLPTFIYFVVLIKCGNHQTALSARYGVVGDAAKAATGAEVDPEVVTATAVRLYKYAIRDYYEDFVNSVRMWAHASIEVLPKELSSQPQAANLQTLYTKRVVPPNLVEHVAEMTCVPWARRTEYERTVLMNRWVGLLVELLKPDEHPTLTRFFTFRCCVDKMLTMMFIGLHPALKVQGVKLKAESQKRLKRIHSFSELQGDTGAAPRFTCAAASRRC